MNGNWAVKHNSTLTLMKVLGSPFQGTRIDEVDDLNIVSLYQESIKNRIPLFFLDVLKERRDLFFLEETYQAQNERYIKIFYAMARVSKFLSSNRIKHAIFKSIKPFPDASVDIDTIIFNSEQYGDLLNKVLNNGWEFLGIGPQSTTFFDSEAKVGIDLYREIAVSCVVYLDKEKIIDHITRRTLPNGKSVFTLTKETDLIATIAHSILKEQLFTLAEFYTLLRGIHTMDSRQIDDFLELVEENDIIQPVRSFSTLAYLLHYAAFHFVPEKLLIITERLGMESSEEKLLIDRGFQTPHKYHPFTFGKSLLGRMRDEKTRKSFAYQGFKMMNPKFTHSVILGIIDHLSRQTY